jgi:peroxiredoxin
VEIKDGPLAGLVARAVFVVGKDGKPNYDAALAAARSAAG